MPGGGSWSAYRAWNEALHQTIFTADNAGRPVYLDMDDDVLAAVAGRLSVDAAEAADRLAVAVRGTLWLDRAGDSVFQEHVDRVRAWRAKAKVARDRREEVGFPPVVALLAVLTLAAEAMEGDLGHAAHAYYPRLCELLKVTDVAARHRLESAYRRHAELLWSSLNEWLSAVDGKYGRPSPPANDQVRPRGRRRHPHPRSEPDGPPGRAGRDRVACPGEPVKAR